MTLSHRAVAGLLFALFLSGQVGAQTPGDHSEEPPKKARAENPDAGKARRKLTLVETINAMDGRLTDEQLPVYERFIDAYIEAGGKGLRPLFQEPNLATKSQQTVIDALKKNPEFAKLSPEEQKKELQRFLLLDRNWAEHKSMLRAAYEEQIEELFRGNDFAQTLAKMVENSKRDGAAKKPGAWAKLSSIEAVITRNGGKPFESLSAEAAKAAESIHQSSDGPPIKTQLAYIGNKLNRLHAAAGSGFQKAYESANQLKHVATPSETFLAGFKGDKDFEPAAWRAQSERAKELKEANLKVLQKSDFSILGKAFGQAIVTGGDAAEAFEAALQTSGMPSAFAKDLLAQGKRAGIKGKPNSSVGSERLMAYLEFYLPLAERKEAGAKR